MIKSYKTHPTFQFNEGANQPGKTTSSFIIHYMNFIGDELSLIIGKQNIKVAIPTAHPIFKAYTILVLKIDSF